MLKPEKLPMNSWLPRKARSELAKFKPLPRGGVVFSVDGFGVPGFSVAGLPGAAGGVAGFSVPGFAGDVSGSVGDPAGSFGSKNPGGFGSVVTSSMLSAATPASFNPALRPTRGSFDAGGA